MDVYCSDWSDPKIAFKHFSPIIRYMNEYDLQLQKSHAIYLFI